MANNLLPAGNIDDDSLRRQIIDILINLTHANIKSEGDFFILTSPNGGKYKLKVDDSGNLSTEVV